MNTRSTRAKPLSPDERRAAILDAVLPLLIDHGAAVTTAEMARAAGIAEGTIFGVFADKGALLHAAIAKVMDPAPIETALEAIDEAAPLETQLVEAARILVSHFENVAALMGMLRSLPHEEKSHSDSHKVAHDSMTAMTAALTRLFERSRDNLTVEPNQAAIVLRGLAFTNAHPILSPDGRMTPEDLASILSRGILRTEEA